MTQGFAATGIGDIADAASLAARIGKMDDAAPLDLVIANAGISDESEIQTPDIKRYFFALRPASSACQRSTLLLCCSSVAAKTWPPVPSATK